jgi:hypothetical protein
MIPALGNRDPELRTKIAIPTTKPEREEYDVPEESSFPPTQRESMGS